MVRAIRPLPAALAGLGLAACLGWWWVRRENPQRYVEQALDVMEKNSLKRDTIDWPKFREAVRQDARGALIRRDTYPALRTALHNLGDHHSFLRPAPAWGPFRWLIKSREASLHPRGEIIDQFGYIWVPGFTGESRAATTAFADEIGAIITRLDAQDPAGWIIDLRDNRGGNMWPMLAGIGPILGEGDAGAFIPLHGKTMHWTYRNGAAGIDGHPVATVSGRPYQLRQPSPRVAVLTGPRTVSSGEAVVVAFRGRPLTRSFGEPTQGLSTGNRGFMLSDGATIFLTTSIYADRTGRIYGAAIEPDELVDHTRAMKPVRGDRDIDAAVSWLKPAQITGSSK